MVPGRNYLLTGLIALGLLSANALTADDDAMSQVVDMATKMAEAKKFSVSIRMGYDAVQESGQKIEFTEERKMLVSRPNHLRVDARHSNGNTGGLVFDGEAITLFNTSENVYSITSQAGNLDGAIRYAVGKLGMRVPLARMLLTTFPQNIQKLSSDVDYVEHNTLGATPTDHIAGLAKEVDYQVWIAEDSLPRRIILTYKNAPGQPQFWAEFSDWNLKPKIKATSFSYKPPKGAEKIPTLLPAAKAAAVNKTPGGA